MKRNEVKHIMSERNVLLQNVKHPFLVGLHYSFQTPDKLYFVLDYVNGGEVRIRECCKFYKFCPIDTAHTHIKSRVEVTPEVELFPYTCILDNTGWCY